MTSSLVAAATVHGGLAKALRQAADRDKAHGMRAYMKHHFTFLGVTAPDRRIAMKAVLGNHGLTRRTVIPSEWLAELALKCWQGPHREMQYLCGDVLEFFSRSVTLDMFDSVIAPIFDEADPSRVHWWDSVDHLVGCAISPIALKHDITKTMRRWVEGSGQPINKRADGPFSPELAKVRAAILHQLHHGRETNEDVLFEFCSLRAADREFFVGKAIGWALREYSYVASDAVERFVESCADLTPLAQREGLKVILKRRNSASPT